MLLAVAACSAPDTPPQVASLSTPSSTAASPAAPTEQRPRERLDMTPEDHEALNVPFAQCMGQHGLDYKGRPLEGSGRQPGKEEVDKALKDCESKIPLPPWEKDASNPEAVDFANRVVQCLREKGVRYVEVVNEPGATAISYAFGGPNNDAASISLGLEHAQECEIAASGR
ncbi:hypothetical protein ADL03_08300 [Nocardia sp. NRRL S-836]|nr:hypothetical protein ADL03_08300 [Nocardia sp. NRRL S-836]